MGGSSGWGFASTYDHAMGIPQPCRNNDRDRRNGPCRTFQRMGRYGQSGINCSVGDEVRDAEDNGDYVEEDPDNSDYQRDHSQRQVNFAANGDSYSPK